MAYTLALNNNLNKNNLNNVTPSRRVDGAVAQKRHSPDGARVSPPVVEEVRKAVHPNQQYVVQMSTRREVSRRRTEGHAYDRRGHRHRHEDPNRSSGSRVIYSSDGHYTRYPQPSPPKPYQPDQSSGTYSTSIPVRDVSFEESRHHEHSTNSSIYSSPSTLTTTIRDDSRSSTKSHHQHNHSIGVYKTSTPVLYGETLRRDPSGDSTNIYSSPSTLTTTIRDDDSRPTPPYITPPAYSSAVRRSPSGASFEFSPSPIHGKRHQKTASDGSINRNIDNGANTRPKSCDKLDILEVISNHSSQESNYEEITNLSKAKEGVKEMTRTEPKTVDSSSNEAIYDRLIADLAKGVEGSAVVNRTSSVLSARQRASLVCPAGLADDSLLRETLENTIERFVPISIVILKNPVSFMVK